MLEILLTAAWVCFAAYAIWYLTLAKHYAPISQKEARILWKIHKRNVHCNAGKWRRLKRGSKIIGFECECGYRHIQRRPIAANKPALNVDSQITAFDQLHTSYKSK